MYGFVGRSSLLSHDISVLVDHKNCQPCIVGLHTLLIFVIQHLERHWLAAGA